jgi:hypothetical protein
VRHMDGNIDIGPSHKSRLVHDTLGAILIVLVFLVLGTLVSINIDGIIGLSLATIGLVAIMRYTFLHKYLDKDPTVMREFAEKEEEEEY